MGSIRTRFPAKVRNRQLFRIARHWRAGQRFVAKLARVHPEWVARLEHANERGFLYSTIMPF